MRLDPSDNRVQRFAAILDGLAPGERIGLAVSGGSDSVALLLLAAAARADQVEAATLDHGLRPEAASEAAEVADLCRGLGVPHSALTAQWESPPETAIQERARDERYRQFARWMADRGLAALATGHHADDQAETLLMRLNRGAGVQGLAAMRQVATVPGSQLKLIRPLLGWRRSELEQVCSDAGVATVDDPSNAEEQFERVRVRQAIAQGGWLDGGAVAQSASNLADADAALQWMADRIWEEAVVSEGDGFVFQPANYPRDTRRRIAAGAIARLGSEGAGASLRGREVEQLMAVLRSGGTSTLRGVLCSGGERWRFSPAPPRRG